MSLQEQAEQNARALDLALHDARAAASAWEELDLGSLRTTLDGQAEALAELIDERLASKKALAQLAKAFKRDFVATSTAAADAAEAAADAADGSIAPRYDELIKAFKAEVDAATARAKSSEAAFLSLYRLVREDKRPDPGECWVSGNLI